CRGLQKVGPSKASLEKNGLGRSWSEQTAPEVQSRECSPGHCHLPRWKLLLVIARRFLKKLEHLRWSPSCRIGSVTPGPSPDLITSHLASPLLRMRSYINPLTICCGTSCLVTTGSGKMRR